MAPNTHRSTRTHDTQQWVGTHRKSPALQLRRHRRCSGFGHQRKTGRSVLRGKYPIMARQIQNFGVYIFIDLWYGIHPFIHAYIHAYLHIYMFFVVNVDAPAQTSDFRIERRQVLFLCWMQYSNRVSYRESSLKLELNKPSLWSATIQPTRPHCRVAFHTWLWRYTCLLLFLILMLWHRQAIFESNEDKLSSSAECRVRNQGIWNRISSRMNASRKTAWAIENQV